MPTKSSSGDLNLTDAQIDHLITGYNFWEPGGDYGPDAPFRDEEHRREVWFQVRKEFMQRMIAEAEMDALGQWSWRGAYLPWGVTEKSINAYWSCERGEDMPWPEAPTLGVMEGT